MPLMRANVRSLVLALVAVALLGYCSAKKSSRWSRGFNAAVDWKLFDQGIAEADEKGAVALVLIHKSYCGACKGLAKTVERSKTFAELSEDFIMINAEDKEEPAGEMWHPDGSSYVPRVHFYDGATKQLLNISCTTCTGGPPDHPYFYSNVNDVVASMKRATRLKKKLDKEAQQQPNPEL